MVKIKKYYLELIEKEKKGFVRGLIYVFLVLLSFLYRAVISSKNFFYDRGIIKVTALRSKVISVGNITWSGTGKTTLVSILHQALKGRTSAAAVTKGYARDEYLLLKEKLTDVLDAKDRVSLLLKAQSEYQAFILDDGFQYRKLARDLDLVLIKKDDLRPSPFLIPASCFREPLSSLARADIALITYCPPEEYQSAAEAVKRFNKKIKVFSADYEPKTLQDRNGREIPFSDLIDKPVGVLTAIGYPRGFFRTLAKTGITARKTEVYPDHYQFTAGDLSFIEDGFLGQGIRDVIITSKDFHHIDFSNSSLDYYVFIPEFKIREQEQLIREVEKCLGL